MKRCSFFCALVWDGVPLYPTGRSQLHRSHEVHVGHSAEPSEEFAHGRLWSTLAFDGYAHGQVMEHLLDDLHNTISFALLCDVDFGKQAHVFPFARLCSARAPPLDALGLEALTSATLGYAMSCLWCIRVPIFLEGIPTKAEWR